MKENFYLEIIINYQTNYHTSIHYTIQQIEQCIEQKLNLGENRIKNLLETYEYQFIRNHIQELTTPDLTHLICNEQFPGEKILFVFNQQNIDQFVIPIHEKIQFHFGNCNYRILDYSGSDLQELDIDKQIFSSYIHFLILPKKLQQLKCCYVNITSISFTSYNIRKIVIQNNYKFNIFVDNHHINKDILDLSEFNNLKILQFDNLDQDIELPNNLDDLQLYSKTQSNKILNAVIFADDIKLVNLTLLGKKFIQHSKIHLNSCFIDFIQIGDLYYQINCEDTNNLVTNECNSIQHLCDWSHSHVFNTIMLLRLDIESILLKSNSKIIVLIPTTNINTKNYIKTQNLEINQYIIQCIIYTITYILYLVLGQISQNFYKNTTNYSVDLSQLLKLQSYHNNTEFNKILFPINILDINLQFQDTISYRCLQDKVLDFSHLRQLQKLFIYEPPINLLIMPFGQLKFEFSQIQKILIFIQNTISQSLQQPNQMVITNISEVNMSSLKNILINGKILKELDFSKFHSLEKLALKNNDKEIILPTKLKKLSLQYSKIKELDLRDYKYLNLIYFDNCEIQSLISINPVNLIGCKINYFQIDENKNQICQNQKNTINFYDQENTNYYTKNYIKTIKFGNIDNLHKICFSCIEQIFADNICNERIIDLAVFPFLHQVSLENPQCFEIKFGVQQQKIKIYNIKRNIKHLDLSKCRKVKCKISYCHGNIDVISTYEKINFSMSNVKLIKLFNPSVDYQLKTDIYDNNCRYILQHNNNIKYRTLYERNYMFSGFSISAKNLRAEIILVNKLDYIYTKIKRILYN